MTVIADYEWPADRCNRRSQSCTACRFGLVQSSLLTSCSPNFEVKKFVLQMRVFRVCSVNKKEAICNEARKPIRSLFEAFPNFDEAFQSRSKSFEFTGPEPN